MTGARNRTRARILYIQYTNPAAYPPLENSATLLSERGWQVLFLGASVTGAEGLRFPGELAAATRLLPSWTRHAPGPVRYVAYMVWVLTWVVRWRPDWVYASDLLACPPALLLSLLTRSRIVYHEHDAPAAAEVTRRGRAMLALRRWLARRADVRVLPNEARMRHFRQHVVDVQPTFAVWNCPRRADVAAARAGADGGRLRLLYQGSLVPARLPLTVLEALTLVPSSVELVVVGYETGGHRGYRRVLLQAAARMGVADRVALRNELPHADVMALGRTCDAGLALLPSVTEDQNLLWMPGASNKPFEYLANGLVVLVADLPGWREMFVRPGYGLACLAEDAASIANAISWCLEHPRELRAMGERGRRRIAAEWNYETQFAPVLECLGAGLG
ncbi:MAG: glycosyltransferase [Chloroflexi bacterium]|nr:glycosyltransferase [Chloroflexota bacterium]